MEELGSKKGRQYRVWAGVFTVLVVWAMLYRLGMAPLHGEEPRRALIALEMELHSDNWIPREFGELYLKKPPVYNWVLQSAAWLFGGYTEFAVRFFSVVSTLLIAVVLWRWARPFVPETTALAAGLAWLVGADVLLFFSTIGGEIDLFYALVSFAGFATLFHFHQRQQYLWMFLTTYGLHSLGILTKGLPSVAFLALSLGPWLLLNRQWRLLFSWQHAAGIGLMLATAGAYFAYYSTQYPIGPFVLGVLDQSSQRTVGHSIWDYLQMPVQFPYLVLKDLAPFSVFLVLLLWRKGRRVVWENPATRYAVVILLCNLWLYAISPGVRSRYLYMFYPLFALLAAQLWAQVHHRWRPALRLQAVAGWLVVTGVAAASIVLPFVPVFQDNNEPLLALLVLGVALAAVCGWVLVKRPTYQVAVLVAGMLFARILLNHTILVERTTEGNHLDEYRGAQQLIQYTQNGAKPLKILGAEPSRITIFYYTRETRQVATYAYGLQPGEVGITPQALWNPSLPVPVDSFPIYGGTWYVMLQP